MEPKATRYKDELQVRIPLHRRYKPQIKKEYIWRSEQKKWRREGHGAEGDQI